MSSSESLDGDANPSVPNLGDLRQILQAILLANETLLSSHAIRQLLDRGDTSQSPRHPGASATDIFEPDSRVSRAYAGEQLNAEPTNTQIWESIVRTSATESDEFMSSFYDWPRSASVQDVLNKGRQWTSWSYTAAFPALSKFLGQATLSQRLRCRVWMEDFHTFHDEPRSISYSEPNKGINALWQVIKNRTPIWSIRARPRSDRVSVRLFQIVDLSPLVLSAILGSTPQ
jgi:hypothetical protein